jgi:hypothetical protein
MRFLYCVLVLCCGFLSVSAQEIGYKPLEYCEGLSFNLAMHTQKTPTFLNLPFKSSYKRYLDYVFEKRFKDYRFYEGTLYFELRDTESDIVRSAGFDVSFQEGSEAVETVEMSLKYSATATGMAAKYFLKLLEELDKQGKRIKEDRNKKTKQITVVLYDISCENSGSILVQVAHLPPSLTDG